MDGVQMNRLLLYVFGLVLFSLVDRTVGHGRLIEPPSRSSMWRYDFPNPPNYNDHEGYCGGFTTQWIKNGGKCGICGDAWDSTKPRMNEAGGRYANGIIVRKYKKASVIKVGVQLTANHKGYFEFRLCPNNNFKRTATQKCLDRHVLHQADGSGPRYYPGPGNREYFIRYQLPKHVVCSQCVFQWRYVAGNNWGTCPNGTGMLGCGPQEEFRACADVSIGLEEGEIPMDYDDYNDIDIEDTHKDDHHKKRLHKPDYAGYVAAVICGCLLPIFIFIGLILYFYCIKSKIKQLLGGPVPPPTPRVEKVSSIPPLSFPPKGKEQLAPAHNGFRPVQAPPLPPQKSNNSFPPVRPPRSRSVSRADRVAPSYTEYDSSRITVNGVAV